MIDNHWEHVPKEIVHLKHINAGLQRQEKSWRKSENGEQGNHKLFAVTICRRITTGGKDGIPSKIWFRC